MNHTISKTGRLAGMAILIGVIVLLQAIGGFLTFGSFSVTLVLVPIVVGAAMYGTAAGAVLGAAFGVIVLINCINGTDLGGSALWAASPVLTALLCIVKGAAAGCAAGFAHDIVSKRNKTLGVICAAVVCPVVNTGIFLGAMALFFRETLNEWAAGSGSSVLYYTFILLAGVNFLLELGVNIVLSPTVSRIINIIRKQSA